MKRIVATLVLILGSFCTSSAWSATPLKTPRPAIKPISQSKPNATLQPVAFIKPPAAMRHLATLMRRNRAPEGSFGYVLIDAWTGEVLSGHNENSLFIPASLAKIPTSVAALAAYGFEQTFETRLLMDGNIVSGTLKGDLHLVGSGDPSLKTRDLQSLADALDAAGIKKITGAFYHHADAIPRTPSINRRQPKGAHYNPGVSGLNIDLNLDRKRVAVARPAPIAASSLRKFARARGIRLPHSIEATTRPSGIEIGVHRSAPLSDLMVGMLKTSNNMTAEALGSLAAAGMGRNPTTLSDAASVTTEWLAKTSGATVNVNWEGFHMANHSGLSLRSRATPRQMAAILRLGYQRFGSPFVALYRKEASGSTYSVHAKIGTMRYIRGLGGFLNVGGRDLIFTIMSNDIKQRAKNAGSSTWMNKARFLEQALLSDWLAAYWPTRTAGL